MSSTREATGTRRDDGRYDAFISYSHAVDGKLAPALRSGLARFAKPWYRLRALRAFHDSTSLAVNPDLWAGIQAALRRSKSFVLLASPAAAASRWVNDEVKYWRSLPGDRPIVVVLTEGEIVWDRRTRDFDWTATTALPLALRGAFRAEPLWLDLRWARQVEQVSLRHPGFRDVVAGLSATLRGRAKEDLLSEDVRLWRRTRLLAAGAISGLAILTVLAVTTSILALQQRNTARSQTNIAISRQLVAQAQALRDQQPELSMLLGVEAVTRQGDATARSALVDTLVTTHLTGMLRAHQRGVSGLAVRPDGAVLASADTDGVAVLWDRRTGSKLAELRPEVAEQSASGLAFSPDGKQLALIGDTVSLWNVADPAAPQRLGGLSGLTNPTGVVFVPGAPMIVVGAYGEETGYESIWNIADPPHPVRLSQLDLPAFPKSVAVSPDGHTMAATDNDGNVSIVDITDPERPKALTALPGVGYSESGVAFSPDGTMLAAGDASAQVSLWSLADPIHPSRLAVLIGHTYSIFAIAFSPTGDQLVTGSADATALIWDVSKPANPRIVATLAGHHGPVSSTVIAPDGQVITGGNDHVIRLWRVAPTGPRRLADLTYTADPQPRQSVYSAYEPKRGLLLVDVGGDDGMELWDTRDPAHPTRLGSVPGNAGYDQPTGSGFSGDGNSVISFDDEGVSVWDISSPEHPVLRGHVDEGDDYFVSAWLNDNGTEMTIYTHDEHLNLVPAWWRIADGRAEQLTAAPSDVRHGGLLSPDGTMLATTDFTTHLYRLNGTDRRLLANLSVHKFGVGDVAFARDGRTVFVATGQDDTVEVWNIADPTNPVRTLTLTDHTDAVFWIAVSPDGHLLAAGGADRSVILWDITEPASPLRVATIPADPDYNSVSFSPDGKTLAVSGYNVTLWDVSELGTVLADPIKRACQIAGGGLSTEDWIRYLPTERYRDTCP